MTVPWQWLWRLARTVAAGILLAILVTELELALGFDLLDAPAFHAPALAIALGAGAVTFAAYQTRPPATAAGMAAGVLAFGIIVLPFNALLERPATPVELWKGSTGLLLDRTMTVNRPHAVILVTKGAQPIANATGAGSSAARDVLGADTLVARVFGDPRSSFTVVPDNDQARSISLTDDMRWVWTATPRQEGVQRLILELDTIVKNPGAAATASNLYRQLIRITVQPPSWYEAARSWLIGLVSGS